MRYLKLLMAVFFMCNSIGCAKAESSEIKGKLWFNDINFPKVEYKTATLGMSYYENGKKIQLYEDRINPVPSKDGNVLFSEVLDFDNAKNYYELRALEINKELYRIENTNFYRIVLDKSNYKRLYVVKNDDGVHNLFSYSFESNEFKRLTNYVEKEYIIWDIAISDDNKYIVYSRYFQPEINALRKLYVLSLETMQTVELPYSTMSIEFYKNNNKILFSGVRLKENEVASKPAMYSYDLATKSIDKIEYATDESFLAIPNITFSPDGKQVAFIKMSSGGGNSIWVMNADGTNQKRLPIDGVFSYLEWTD